VNHAKLIFSCNEVPGSYDLTLAWFRRIVITDFPNRFTADAVDESCRANTRILEGLTTPTELSGLLNHAIHGLQRLLQQGRFTNERSFTERKDDYIRRSNPIQYFALQYVETDLDAGFLSNDALYQAYYTVCRDALQVFPKSKQLAS
jgi:putative DNA primase/helicase